MGPLPKILVFQINPPRGTIVDTRTPPSPLTGTGGRHARQPGSGPTSGPLTRLHTVVGVDNI